MFDARNSGEIHTAFAELVRVIKADATITAIDPVLLDCHEQMVAHLSEVHIGSLQELPLRTIVTPR